MNFAQQQADPRRHLVGITVVILFHVLVVYALVSGLAKKIVDVVKAPIETKVIEEIKPPPPPEKVIPPPPKLEAPPPPFIPPPEIQLSTPPPPQPTITTNTVPPPPAPVVIAPAPAPVVVAAPAAPPAPPAVVSAGVACSNYKNVMDEVSFPRDAQRQGIERGDALIQFTLTAGGEVRNIQALRASNPIFARNSIRIVGEYKCQGQGRDITVQVPFNYTIQ